MKAKASNLQGPQGFVLLASPFKLKNNHYNYKKNQLMNLASSIAK